MATQSDNRRRWCSGNINAFQAFALGSIPGRRMKFLLWLFSFGTCYRPFISCYFCVLISFCLCNKYHDCCACVVSNHPTIRFFFLSVCPHLLFDFCFNLLTQPFLFRDSHSQCLSIIEFDLFFSGSYDCTVHIFYNNITF